MCAGLAGACALGTGATESRFHLGWPHENGGEVVRVMCRMEMSQQPRLPSDGPDVGVPAYLVFWLVERAVCRNARAGLFPLLPMLPYGRFVGPTNVLGRPSIRGWIDPDGLRGVIGRVFPSCMPSAHLSWGQLPGGTNLDQTGASLDGQRPSVLWEAIYGNLKMNGCTGLKGWTWTWAP